MMRIKTLLLMLVLCCTALVTQAQERTCASHDHLLEQLQDPENANQFQMVEQQVQDFIANYNPAERVVITIPIVFHIIHNGDAVGSNENISDAQIMAQLDQLNLDFSATNSDINTVPGEFAGDVANAEIQFCLATTDPNGNATTGIIRHQFGSASWGTGTFDSQVKPATIWDRDCYLNFWSANLSGGLLGYAQFPGTGAANTDGVVQLYSSIGSVAQPFPGGAPFNLGRTATHEIGHWLNLRHIWGDANCGNDFVADTPTQQSASSGCPSHPRASCGSNDMFMNYMDYTNDACMVMFSEGQKARMVATLNGFRSGVRASCACTTAGPSCTDGIQNGNETGIDCGGPDCPACPTCNDGQQNGDETGVDCGGSCPNSCPESCDSPIPLGCNSSVSGTTVGGQNSYNTYLPDGYTGWNGPEAVYSFTVTATGTVTIDLTYPGGTSAADLDIFLFDTCDPTQNYIGVSFNAPNEAEQISVNLNPGTYYIIVDGDNTDAGPFNLALSCPNTTPTCTDGVQNGNETGVDCGGPDCPACPTCNDGQQNGDETGVDCGGPDCPACPTCNDGQQNGNETDVDCGGPDCPACPTCNDGQQNGDETGIDCGGPDCPACTDSCGSATPLACNSSVSGTTVGGQNSYNTYLPDGYTGWNGPEAVYTFTVATAGTVTIDLTYPGGTSAADLDLFLFDVCDPTQNYLGVSFNPPNEAEQISVNLAVGTYYIIVDGDNTDAGPFDLALTCPAGPTCDDGILNGNETGIDCGGPDCPTCTDSCGTPIAMDCNSTVSGTTVGGQNSYNTYLPDGYTGWNGPEAVYTFTVATAGTVTIDLTYPGGTSAADLDIFLFDVCDPTQNYLGVSFNPPNEAEQISVNLAAGTYYIIVDGDNTDAGSFNLTLTCPSGVLLSPKVFLQGPLSGTSMNTALMGGSMLPATSPYDGTALIGTAPTNAVDWIMVEIRSDDTASPAQVETASGLLLDDGTIVGPDGSSALSFPVAPGQSWFVVVKHRNHLGIMTNTAILLD